ncbi:hypothetical protein Glove_18g128 [Diversispora epigaea]|uniref:Uncharacterized protein n=1 Tax=Diversispora epigaea TaxID=1348612 RepID=A0A397JQM9_9GLOM|nr:hypothetical protein Glove_18g128 [Diversispora epigaea]
MVMAKYGGKIFELAYVELSRILCTKSKKEDDSVKLWRETLDSISFVGVACRPTNNQFGIVGIQVAGEYLYLNILVKDASGIPRYFHVDQVEIPFTKNTSCLLIQALEQANTRPPRNAQQSPTITSPSHECDLEQFDQKIGLYLKSLKKIANKEKGERQQKALILLERYRIANGAGNLEGWPSSRLKAEPGARLDYHLARKWKSERESTSVIGGPTVHLHNPTFTGNPLVGNSENINGGTFKLSEESVPKRKKNNDHEKVYVPENVDDIRTDSKYDEADLNYDDDLDYDNDDVDYSNYDIDPNIELSEKQIPVQSHLKYPNKDSPDNIWKLPSGKSIDKIIHGPKNLHKSHPSCLDIIRIGSKIRKPEWIKQEDWDYLNSSVEYSHYNLSTEIENLFSILLETNSLNEYKNCLYNVTFDRINQRLLRRNLKPDDDKPLGMKVDSSFQSPNDKGLEIGMIELFSEYLTKDTPRYLKDHVKGNWGCCDLLNEIITKYNHGDYKILRRLRLEVQIWGMDLPVAKTYRMFLIGAFYLPISWDNHYELVHALRVLQNLKKGLDDSLEVLEEFKKLHRRNTIIRFQSSTLKRYIGDAKSSPQKPTGKKSRIINPVVHHMYHDYDDFDDYDDPPSPSSSGHSGFRQLFYD